MRWTGLAAAVVAAMAVGGGVRADDATRLAGKVSKAEKDGAFELTGPKGGPYQVVVNDETLVAVHKVTTLDQVPASTPLHVLAVHQAEQHDPKTGAPIPECVTQVLTIIAGEGFDPPAPAKEGADKHEWLSGALMKDGRGFGLDRVQMNVGKDHAVILLEKGEKAAIAKGKPVVVEGSHTGEVKAKQFTATRVHVLAAGGSASDYHNAFGL
jgi:hypothetical protein